MGRWCFGARSLPSALRPRDSERQCRASGMLLSEGSLYYACRLLTSPSAPRDDRGGNAQVGGHVVLTTNGRKGLIELLRYSESGMSQWI